MQRGFRNVFAGGVFILSCLSPLPAADAQDFLLPVTTGSESSRLIHSADTSRVLELISRSEQYRHGQTDSAIALLREAAALSQDYGFYEGLALSYMKLGNCHYIKGDLQGARDLKMKSLPYCLKVPGKREVLLSMWSNYMLNLYLHTGRYDSAMNYALTGLRLAESVSDTGLIIRSMIQISAIFISNEKFSEALKYLKKAERYAHESGDYSLLSYIFTNYSAVYSNLNDTVSQFYYAFKARDESHKGTDVHIRSLALRNIGFYYLNLGQNDTAISYFRKVMELAGNNPTMSYVPLRALVQAYYYKGDTSTALRYAGEALRAASESGLRNGSVVYLYALLAHIYAQMGEYRNAYAFSDRYAAMNDSLMNAERTLAMDQLEIRYRTLEKDRELMGKHRELERTLYQSRSKTTWIIVISAGAILVSVMLFSFLRSSRRKIHIMQQRDEINTLKAMIRGQEDERSRVGRELHDGIAGLVTAAGMHLSNLGASVKEAAVHPGYQRAEQLLDQINDELRHTAHNLIPAMLLRNNLPDAVRILCANMNREEQLIFEVREKGTFEGIADHKLLAVFRIMQELIQNIIKHARATHALVLLESEPDRLCVSIEDNGTGYELDSNRGGLGLNNIQARVRELNGQLRIQTGRDEGTSVYVEFPKEMLA